MSFILLVNILVMLLRSGSTVPGGIIKECSKTKCKLCKIGMLNTRPDTKNYHNDSIHCIRNNFSCDSSDVIYIIECRAKNCQFQYIGETMQTLRARATGHRSSLRTKKGCPHIIEHFTKLHSPTDLTIKPIEQIFANDVKLRCTRETFLIKDFGTLFPYGGNERLENPYIDAQENFDNGHCIYSLFNHPKSSRGKRGSKISYFQNSNTQGTVPIVFSPQLFISNIITAKSLGLNVRRVICKDINKLKKHEVLLLEKYNQAECKDKWVKHMITDICRHYISKLITVNRSKKSDFIVFTYTNRYLEDINFNQICNLYSVRSLYPLGTNVEFAVSYRYTRTIRSRILNYGTTLLKDTIKPTSCDCRDSPYIDNQLGHVVTGDLGIIQNRGLRNLLCKGINFRECYKYTTDDVMKSVCEDLDTHIKKISSKKSTPDTTFALWKEAIIDNVRRSLARLKIKRFPKPVLKSTATKSYLADLHQKYVLVPTDKAQNNVSIVCKRFYLDVLEQELQSNTYQKIDSLSEDQIVKKHCADQLQKFNIEVEKDQGKLPYIYWTTKQHKNPTGSRFIVSGKSCSTKTISKKLSLVFKLISKTLRSHCRYKGKFLKTSLFWIIDNAKPVQDCMRYLNNNSRAKSMYSYDFSRLYTNIPHDLLIKQLKFVVKEAFDLKSDTPFIRVTAKSAVWTCNPKNHKYFCLDGNDIINLLTYLLDNLYIKYFDQIFKQVIGIPMGSHCGPDLANLFLFAYEYQYILGLIDKGDDYKYSKCRFMFRYIDDLLALNDKGFFDSDFKEIYPDVLDLNCTNINQQSTNYLDMNINISCRNIFEYKLYDKRNDYEFQVISLPNLKSNIPVSAGYSVIYSQVLRYFKATNIIDNFYSSLVNLKSKMVNQNFSSHGITKQFNKFCTCNQYEILAEYWEVPDINLIT